MKNKVLVIVGMHRSGTSLIAQWLYKCGLYLGEEFIGPSVGNKDGHFEDSEFLLLHEEILKEGALSNTGLIDQPVPNVPVAFQEKLKALVEKRNQSNVEWGWKEPRTCLFLPVYRTLLPEAFYLVIKRDYPAVVNSLINRMFKEAEKKYLTLDWFTGFWWKAFRRNRRKKKLYNNYSDFCLNVWINYNEEILKHVSNMPKNLCCIVSYVELKEDDKPTFSHLTDTWNFTLKYFKFRDVYKESLIGEVADIDGFIKDKALLVKAKEIENKFESLIRNRDISIANSVTEEIEASL